MNEERRRQLWLLLLVPWLWLSGFSEAMHHHGFDTVAPASLAAPSASSSAHASVQASHVHPNPANAICAICQWQHSNNAQSFVASPLAPVLDAIVVHPSYSLALLSRAGAISRSRGPPSC